MEKSIFLFFFFKQKTAYEMRISDWSSDVCSSDLIVELVISSTLDDTLVDSRLAPPGQHVASLFCQHVHPEVDGGWDAHRNTVANLMIDTVDRYAPNFRASVLGYQALSPLDLERTFGLVGGYIFHGSLGLDQLFSARPLLGQGTYRGALPGRSEAHV